MSLLQAQSFEEIERLSKAMIKKIFDLVKPNLSVELVRPDIP